MVEVVVGDVLGRVRTCVCAYVCKNEPLAAG